MSSSKSSRRGGNNQGSDTFDHAGDAIAGMADQAGSAAAAAKDAASRIGDQVSETLDQARDAGARAIRSASDTVEEYPIHSVGIAFAAGIVVGILVDRLL